MTYVENMKKYLFYQHIIISIGTKKNIVTIFRFPDAHCKTNFEKKIKTFVE